RDYSRVAAEGQLPMTRKVRATRTPPLGTIGSTCTSSASLDSRRNRGRLLSWSDPAGSGSFRSPRAPWMAAARFGLTPIPRWGLAGLAAYLLLRGRGGGRPSCGGTDTTPRLLSPTAGPTAHA